MTQTQEYTTEELKDMLKTYQDVAYQQGRAVGQREASYVLALALKKLGGKLDVFDHETIDMDVDIKCNMAPNLMMRTYYIKT